MEERTEAILPVLEAQVLAAAQGVKANISGKRRAARNLGAHALLGQGPEALREAMRVPQRSQRGGQQRRVGEQAKDEAEEKDGKNYPKEQEVMLKEIFEKAETQENEERSAKQEVIFEQAETQENEERSAAENKQDEICEQAETQDEGRSTPGAADATEAAAELREQFSSKAVQLQRYREELEKMTMKRLKFEVKSRGLRCQPGDTRSSLSSQLAEDHIARIHSNPDAGLLLKVSGSHPTGEAT